jgi:hypothetical protein
MELKLLQGLPTKPLRVTVDVISHIGEIDLKITLPITEGLFFYIRKFF